MRNGSVVPDTRPPEPPTPPVGAAVRDRRRRLGLTLQAVAEAAGLSTPFISQVERGLASPSITSLIGIAAALGVDIDYFVGVPRPGQIVRRGTTPDLLQLESPIVYQRLSGSHAERKMEALLMLVPPAPPPHRHAAKAKASGTCSRAHWR